MCTVFVDCCDSPAIYLLLQEGEEFLAREAKRTKTDEEAAEEEKDAEVSAEA